MNVMLEVYAHSQSKNCYVCARALRESHHDDLMGIPLRRKVTGNSQSAMNVVFSSQLLLFRDSSSIDRCYSSKFFLYIHAKYSMVRI